MTAAETSPRPGVLIAFEGIDGTGKSTQLRQLADHLRREGYQVVETREPTDGPYGCRIRELYANRRAVSREEELALFLADRRQHVQEVIAPALASGKIILTDRYYLSTAAYQGAAGLDPFTILAENETFAPVPDLVLLLVVPPAVGLQRIRESRRELPNDFEQEENLYQVAAVFEKLANPWICRIEADREMEEVQAEIRLEVGKVLARHRPGGSSSSSS